MKKKICAMLMCCTLAVAMLPSTVLADVEESADTQTEETSYEASDESYAEVSTDKLFLDEDGTDEIVITPGEGDLTESDVVFYEADEDADADEDIEEAGDEDIAEETSEDAGEADETGEDLIFETEQDGVIVKVTAPDGAVPEGAQLVVERYERDSDEYKEAAEAIGHDLTDTNMAAIDISFMLDGEEVEPTDTVKVSMDVSAILPSDADMSSLEVQHLVEIEDGEDVVIDPVVVANDSDYTEGTIDEENAVAEFTVDSFSSFTITWTPETGSSTSTTVTVYVYDMNGLGIYDAEDSYELTADTITISELVSEHASSGISENYTFVYATAQYLTTSNQGGSVTTIGSESDPVSQITWDGTSYVVTTSSGSTTVTKTDTVAAEFYINLYFSTPTVTIAPTGIESGSGNVTLTATTEYFSDSNITYEWEIIDGEDYATIVGNGSTATVTWDTSDNGGEDVTVKVTATSASGETATATYELEYGMQQVTYTVYLPDGTTAVEGAHVSITNSEGKLVSYGTTDANGQVTLWVTAGAEYTLEASYTASSGSGIAMSYTHYTYEDTDYKYNGDGSDNTNIILVESEANFYEHVDVKLSIADQDDEGYSDILANVDYITIYDESGEVVYKSTQMVHNSGTNDYNVLFGDADGNSRGDNDHSIAFYDTYTIEIAYEVTYTYTDESGNSATYTETYVAEINKDSTYIEGEYYSYSGTNAYQLYNELNGTSITEEAWEAALAAGTMDQLLGDGYNEHGIDISGQTYFFVAAALCDTRDTANQAGLDLALGVNSLRRYSSTAWNFEIQKTLKNADMTEGEFSFDLYAANVDEDNTWYIDASGEASDGLQQEYTNSEASSDGTESVTYRSGTYVFNFDSSMVGIPQTYYFVLFEKQGSDDSIGYDDTVYGIAVTVTLNSATDMTDVTITESYCILKQTSESDGYIYYEVSDANPSLSDDEGVTIYPFVNTYNEETKITVEKVWDDNENGYETRPDSITVTVTGSDGSSNTLTLSDSNDWTDTLTGLPVYADDGSTIVYTVTEGTVNGYTGDIAQNDDGTYTITNTLETVDLSGTKTWDDQDNKYELRPDDITIQIMNGEEEVTTTTATAADNWTWSVSGLPMYDSEGNAIEYTIAEVTVPGYESEVDGYNIANSLETVDLSGEKTWDDQDDKYELRPDDITIQIMNGEDVVTTTTATATDNWTWSVSDLPKYDSDGNEIEYTIAEVTVPGYESEVSGYNIANSLETVDLSGTKTWDDQDDKYELRPDDITIQIMNGEDVVTTTTATAADNWTWSVSGLPKTDSDGNDIDYTIAEVTVPGYESEVSGYNITNSLETIDITGTKTWDDASNQDGKRVTEITVNLLSNGTKIDSITVTGDASADSWDWSFTDLPKYDSNGAEITYTVSEDTVEDYETEITGSAANGFEITNSYEPGKVSLNVNKVWVDNDDADGERPSDITVKLIKNGSETGDTLTLNEDNDWTGTFADLDEYTSGSKNEYSVAEVAVDDYVSVITHEDGTTSFVITNTHESLLVTLTGTKVWVDNGEDDSRRPDSITINLYRYTDEEQTESEFVDSIEVTPDADGNWTWTFENLPKYHDHGHEYVYYLTETDVDGYESVIGDVTEDSDEEYSDVITNTAVSDLSVTKEVSGTSDTSEYIFDVELTTPDGDPMDGDVTITFSDGTSTTVEVEDGSLTLRMKAGVTATIESLIYGTGCTVTETTTGADTVTVYVGDDVVASVKGEETEATADLGTIADSTQVKFVNSYRAYYPIDEEIVTDTDDIFDRDAWVKDEAVNEYNAIEIEMTTNLPTVTGYDLANGEFTMNFHEVLDHELVLDEDTADFSVYIAGNLISTAYYRITFDDDTGDDCNFHVDVDLTALYNDGIVTDDMLDGNTEITIFFFADLEGTGLNGSYKSTIWYDIYDGDEWLYTSNESVVEVYTYEIEILKYDASTLEGDDYADSGLAGATLGVYYDEDCTDPVSRNGEAYTVTSGDDGMAIFYGLADGTYYVTEIEAPSGYVLSDEVLTVELGSDMTGYAYEDVYANTPESDEDNGGGSGSGSGGGNGSGGNGGAGPNEPNPTQTPPSKTSDANLPILPIAGCFAAIAAIAGVLVVRRRRI